MNMAFSVWLLHLFFIVPIVDQLVAPTVAQNDGPCTLAAEFCWKCSDSGSYTNGSIYQQNLDSLLSYFSSTESASGFYNSSFGRGTDTVNAIALCRGDLALDVCGNCVESLTEIILRNCSLNKQAILWSEKCMLRYSPNSIFGIEEEDPVKYVPSPNLASNKETFKVVRSSLLKNLSDRAASGNSGKNFAAGHATVPGGKPIYSLVRCTPDIDKGNCSKCLENCISAIPSCCDEMEGARVLRPSCNIRYESDQFYSSAADTTVQVNVSAPVAPASPSPPLPKQGKSNTKNTIIIIIVAVIALGTEKFLYGANPLGPANSRLPLGHMHYT